MCRIPKNKIEMVEMKLPNMLKKKGKGGKTKGKKK